MVLLVLAVGTGPLWATTYVVDPSGSDNATGSVEQPWRSIRRAAAAVQPGDTVMVRAGTYVETVPVTTSGRPDAPIELRAAPGVVLESPDRDASLSAFDFASGVGHIVLDGFTARGGFHETVMLRTGVHDVTVRNCELYGNRVGVWMRAVVDVTIDHCSIHDNSGLGLRVAGNSRRVTVRETVSANNDDGRGCLGDADGFSVEETASAVSFIGCRAEGNAEDGFDVQGDAALLAAVESRDNGCAGIKLWQSGRIENALAVGNTTGLTTGSFFAAPTLVEVVNSTVADNHGTQILLRSPTDTAAYTVALRNVIAAGDGKIVEVEWPVVLLEDHNLFFRPDTTSGVIVRHLIDGAERRYSGQDINAGRWLGESGQGRGSLAIDPGFVDSSYRVAPDSAAVDRGEAVGAPSIDRADIARPLGGGVDIGVDELSVAAPNHRPWADPGPERSVTAGTSLSVQGLGSVDPDGGALVYTWDFGDGSAPANGYAARHTYAAPGEYRLALTVSDGALTHMRATTVHVRLAPPPTATPTPTVRPTRTATPTSISSHDSEIRVAPQRVTVQLEKGRAAVVKLVRVVVRNADVTPVRERPGHVIRVVVEPGDCPPQVVSGLPDFEQRSRGLQDRAVVAGGRTRRAVVSLLVDSAFFFTPAADRPSRCRLRVAAVSEGSDPTPSNNVAEIELQVVDGNDF